MVTIPGIGYQQENIQTPVPNADAGTLNVRADVAGAGAGWESVARAGNEIAAAAERIKRQEDLTAVLKAKNESSIEINQGLIDYAPKMTGNLAQDQAEWDKIAAKIGQKHMAALGNPVREQAFAKDFDTMHKASIIHVQNLSQKNQMEQFKTAATGQLVNLTRGAQAVVQAGPADYVNQVDAQFQSYAEIIQSSPLLSQAEKDSNIQAAEQHFYMEVAKFQAESTPGAFSRDWRDGVWTKHLTPEAITALQPLAKRAEVDNAYNTVTQMFTGKSGGVDYAAAVRYMRDPKNFPDMPLEQRNRVESAFHAADSERWQQVDRARHEYVYGIQVNVQKLVAAGKLSEAQRLVTGSNLPIGEANSIIANIAAGGYRRDDADTYGTGMDMVVSGRWQDSWGLQQLNSGKLSDASYERFRKLAKEADIPTTAALKDGNSAIDAAFARGLTESGSPLLAERELQAKRELAQAVDEAKRNGKDVISLVTPGNKDYILGNIIYRNRPSMDEELKSRNEFWMKQPGPSSGPSYRPIPDSMNNVFLGPGSPIKIMPQLENDKMRKPGETSREWRKRLGIE